MKRPAFLAALGGILALPALAGRAVARVVAPSRFALPGSYDVSIRLLHAKTGRPYDLGDVESVDLRPLTTEPPFVDGIRRVVYVGWKGRVVSAMPDAARADLLFAVAQAKIADQARFPHWNVDEAQPFVLAETRIADSGEIAEYVYPHVKIIEVEAPRADGLTAWTFACHLRTKVA